MKASASPLGVRSTALNAEYQSLLRETDPELRDRGLLGFAHRLESAGFGETARSLYIKLGDSTTPSVQSRARQHLSGREAPWGLRAERWLADGARSLADPKLWLPMAAGGVFLRIGASRLGHWALSAAFRMQRGWSGLVPLTRRAVLPAAAGLLTACRSRSEEHFRGVAQWVRREKLEINGNDSAGRVLYIRQMHDFPGLTSQEAREVADYQRHILNELEREKPNHIFLESLAEDYPPRSKFHPRPGPFQLIRNVFPSGIPRELNASQQKLLLEAGAGMIYAALRDEVFLHKTWTEEEAEENYRRLYKGTGREALAPEEAVKDYGWIIQLEKNVPEVFDARETMAVREVMHLLEKERGAKAALIFGAAHEFADDFKKQAKVPTLRSVVWEPGDSRDGAVWR
ncbi:hypothetical protein FBR05_10030 [Deltaproteobacteria bacterium PRO3]|nr:hypothetical protein [Deltaproteobacteria bacterium PRO3]